MTTQASHATLPVQPAVAGTPPDAAPAASGDTASDVGVTSGAAVAHTTVDAAPDAVSAESAAPSGPLRRVPVQGRSVARVARMLDACAELVDEMGYEALTTTLLAERAGVAIGSIYQFFPDKRAVVQALTLRNLEAYLSRITARFADSQFSHWWDGVDAAIDEYIQMHREVPGFKTLHFGDVVDVHLLDEDKDNNEVIAEALTALLNDAFSNLSSRADIDFPIAMAVETADALIKLAFRRDPHGDERVLAEAKSLIRDYLQQHVHV